MKNKTINWFIMAVLMLFGNMVLVAVTTHFALGGKPVGIYNGIMILLWTVGFATKRL